MDELYSFLGYSKIRFPGKYKTLDAEIHAHFLAYEKDVKILGSREKLSDEILLCAIQFLTESSRGEVFWPDNSNGFPIWPVHQSKIRDTIGDILRRKAKGSSVRRSKANSKAKQVDGTPNTKSRAKSSKKRQREESYDEDYGTANTSSKRRNEVVNELAESSKLRSYTQHIKSLNPRADMKKVTDFTMTWLRTKSSQWPEMADVKLLNFMHNREFYVSHYGNRSDLIKILKKGSEIEILDAGVLYDTFRTRIRDRIKFLVSRITTGIEYPILELKSAGNAQMTPLFAMMWSRREEIWEQDFACPLPAQAAASIQRQNPNKRRKTSVLKKPQSPIAFPNLGKEIFTTMKKTSLASMAGLALEMDTNEQEGAKSELQLTDQAPMSAVAASYNLVLQTRYSSRSLSVENSIVVDSLGRAARATSSTSHLPSPLRDAPWDELEVFLDANNSKDLTASGRQLSTLPPNEPLTSISTRGGIVPHDRTRPGSRDGAMNVKNVTENGQSGQFMIVDDTGNAKFLKIEPTLDTTPSVPATPHSHMLPVSRQLIPSLAVEGSVPSDLSTKPSWVPEPDARDVPTPHAVILGSPVVPTRIRTMTASSIETITGNIVSPSLSSPSLIRSPRTSSPPSSPETSSPAINKFLSHYGSQENKPGALNSPKEMLSSDSRLPPLAPKQRLLAEKRAIVLAEAAEWHEIRDRETRASSQLSKTQEPQGEAAPPVPVSAGVSVANELPGSTDGSMDSSNINHELPDNSNQVQIEPHSTKTARCESVSSSSGSADVNAEPTSNSDDPSDIPHSQLLPSHNRHDINAFASPTEAINEQNPADPPCQNSIKESPLPEESDIPTHGLIHLMDLPREELLHNSSHLLEPTGPKPPSAALSDSPLIASPSISAEKVPVHYTSGSSEVQDDSTIKDSVEQDAILRSSSDNKTALSKVSELLVNAEVQSSPVQTDQPQSVKDCASSSKSDTPHSSVRKIDTRTTGSPETMTSGLPTHNEAQSSPVQTEAPHSFNLSAPSQNFDTLPASTRQIDVNIMDHLETVNDSLPTFNEARSSPMQTKVPQSAKASALSQESETMSLSAHETDSGLTSPPETNPNNMQSDASIAASRQAEMVATISKIRNDGSHKETTDTTTLKEQEVPAIKASTPTTEDLPPQRNGSYSYVPEPLPFSSKPTSAESATFLALHSHQHSSHPKPPTPSLALTKSSLAPGTKTLELVIESASGITSVSAGYPFSTLLNNTLYEFFIFYASVSEAPIESFQELVFEPTWPGCSTTLATKMMGEKAWGKLKRLLECWWRQAVRKEPEEEEFQIVVRIG